MRPGRLSADRRRGAGIFNVITDFICEFSQKKQVRDELDRVAKRTNVAWLLNYTRGREDLEEYLKPGGRAFDCDINDEIVGLVEKKP